MSPPLRDRLRVAAYCRVSTDKKTNCILWRPSVLTLPNTSRPSRGGLPPVSLPMKVSLGLPSPTGPSSIGCFSRRKPARST